MSLTNCRFYEEKYPEIDSFVMVNVKQVWADTAWATGAVTQAAAGGHVSNECCHDRSPRWVPT